MRFMGGAAFGGSAETNESENEFEKQSNILEVAVGGIEPPPTSCFQDLST